MALNMFAIGLKSNLLHICHTGKHEQIPGGGYFLVKDYWGCAAGWGRIFTTGLTIMGLHFYHVLVEFVTGLFGNIPRHYPC